MWSITLCEGGERELTQPVSHHDVRNLQNDHFDWSSNLLLTETGLRDIGGESIQQKTPSLRVFPHGLRHQLHHLVLREIFETSVDISRLPDYIRGQLSRGDDLEQSDPPLCPGQDLGPQQIPGTEVDVAGGLLEQRALGSFPGPRASWRSIFQWEWWGQVRPDWPTIQTQGLSDILISLVAPSNWGQRQTQSSGGLSVQ